MKSSPEFVQAYRSLNTQQKVAVDTIEGPVMVLAGPGTGKTQILATRIANILLKTDTPPYAILALTFTESAAKNMRERLIQLIGPTAYSVHVQTFHSFCDDVIKSYPEYFPVSRESQVLSDLERYDIMEKLLQNPKLRALRTMNSPYHYLKVIIKTISDLKREGVDEEKFAELVEAQQDNFEAQKADLKKTDILRQEKDLAKMQEISLIYTQYQQQLRKLERYDYDDMIAFVAAAFEREPDLLLTYQEKLTYFLVDEYQDTNASQNKVVDLLASFWGEKANIFVVGDPHQSIYRFQGASLENTLNFVTRYPAATIITLDVGYRSPQVIYNAASAVIQNNEAELPAASKLLQKLNQPLKTTKNDGKLIAIFSAPTSPIETIYIAEQVRKLIEAGTPAEEIAVLFRNNADAKDIQLALDKWGIPYNLHDGNDALQTEEIQQFLTFLKVIADIRSSTEGYELFEVMNYPWTKLDRLLVMRVARAAGKTKMSIYDRISAGYTEFCRLQFCDDVSAMDFALLDDFIGNIARWGQMDAQMTFPEWFEAVMSESGFLDWLMQQSEKVTLLHHLNALFREVKALTLQQREMNLERFLQAITTMREHKISISSEEVREDEHAVTLSTVHKAKGREWEYVFIAQCIDGKWGNARRPNSLPLPEGILLTTHGGEKDRNEDDRRLFYVALTRTKKQVTITYPETIVNGGASRLAIGSMFIEEIPATLKEKIQQPELIKKADVYIRQLLQRSPEKVVGVSEREWLKSIVGDFKLSVTALNTYLRSPQEFLESALLKVPRAKPGYMAFGTAIHFALEQMYGFWQKNDKPPLIDFVLDNFEKAFEKEILTKEEYTLRFERGREILRQYYQHYSNQLFSPVAIEKFYGYGFSKTVLGDIELNGRVDRIDWLDKSKQTAVVIDYKTGKAKSVNEIEGKVATSEFSERELALPENIRGPYKRQLLFYKLLTQLDTSSSYTVEEGIFDFVQPNEQGKFIQRRFALLDEDVEALKKLIQEVMAEIRALKFLA